MADLSREDIAHYRAVALAVEKLPEDTVVPIEASELLSLLSMAERAVSEETVRKLAMHDLMLDKDTSDTECDDVWDEFIDGVRRDLRPSAEALARSAAEGKDG